MELNRLFLPPLTAPGEVVTFYSYKGGTGRTMALSNIAVLLARRQNATVPVLMIDWDMEAPGLHHYFDPQQDGPGVLEFFETCREQLALRRRDGHTGDDAALAREVLGAIDWEQYVVRVDQSSQLYLMRAGRFDAAYGERLAQMHWDRLEHVSDTWHVTTIDTSELSRTQAAQAVAAWCRRSIGGEVQTIHVPSDGSHAR